MSSVSPFSWPWPSEALLPAAPPAQQLPAIPPPLRRPGVFNAGVVGDGVMNVIYRLQGSGGPANRNAPEAPRTTTTPELEDLFAALGSRRHVRLWVVHVGANDLLPSRPWDPLPLYVLLELLFRNSSPSAKVLLTGLFHAAGAGVVPDGCVDRLNAQYRWAVEHFGRRYGAERIQFLAAPPEYSRDAHLAQGPHLEALCSQDLNLAGYRMWARHLVPKMWQMMQAPAEQAHGGGVHPPRHYPEHHATTAADWDVSDEETQPLLGRKDNTNGTRNSRDGGEKGGNDVGARNKGALKYDWWEADGGFEI